MRLVHPEGMVYRLRMGWMTDKTFDKLEKWFDEMEAYSSGQSELGNKYKECMEPFYKGKRSYKESIEEFKKFMELYYSE